MAAYLIEPRRLRLDYDTNLCEAINYAIDNRLHIQLFPAGTIMPRHIEVFPADYIDVTAFGDPKPVFLTRQEMEVRW